MLIEFRSRNEKRYHYHHGATATSDDLKKLSEHYFPRPLRGELQMACASVFPNFRMKVETVDETVFTETIELTARMNVLAGSDGIRQLLDLVNERLDPIGAALLVAPLMRY